MSIKFTNHRENSEIIMENLEILTGEISHPITQKLDKNKRCYERSDTESYQFAIHDRMIQ